MQRTSWTAVAVAIFSGMVAATAIGKVPPALPGMREQLGLSLVEAGWVSSTFSTLGCCCALFLGTAGERIGPLRLALIGFATMIAGAASGAAATSYAGLLLARVLEGSGFIAVVVTLPALITRSTAPGDFRLALGLWSIYLPFGSSAMMLVAPSLLPTLGWRGLWIALAAATFACALLLYRLRDRFGAPPPRAAGPGAGTRIVREALGRVGVWVLAGIFFTYTLQWFTLMVWLPSFLVDTRGLSPSLAGALTAAVVAANVPGNVLGGWLGHRGVPRGVLVCVASLLMLVAAVGIFDDRLPDGLRYGLCVAFTVVGGILPAAAFAGMAAHAPSPRHLGAVNGLLVQGSNLGQLVGPPLVAAVVTATGDWQSATGVMALASGCGIAGGLVLLAIERRAAADAAFAAAPESTG